jgi:hypothetical protein
MAIAAKDIIHRSVDTLQDTTSIRWPVNELIRYLNDGQREVVMYRPDAMVTNDVIVCAAGSRQTLREVAAGGKGVGAKLIDVVRNVTSGLAVRLTNREILDSQMPGWHNFAGVTDIKHYMFDPRDPKMFYVYPPAATGTTETSAATATGTSGTNVLTLTLDNTDDVRIGAAITGTGIPAGTRITSISVINAAVTVTLSALLTAGLSSTAVSIVTTTGAQLDVVYAAYPTDVAEIADGLSYDQVAGDISLPDIYGNVLNDYILYRAYSKDSEYAGNGQRSQNHYAAFANSLGIEIKATVAVAPTSQNNPNVAQQRGQAQ